MEPASLWCHGAEMRSARCQPETSSRHSAIIRIQSNSMPELSAIVVSRDARPYIEQSLGRLVGSEARIVLVDCGSTDGTPAFVLDRFPEVDVLELGLNPGYGAAVNEGARRTSGAYLLVMNADAWPAATDSLGRLLAFTESAPSIGAVGPRLLNRDGSLQRSIRGFPTLWRLATEYLFLRWLQPHSRVLNAFYGAGFEHDSVTDAEFLVGAVLLLRRDAFEQVGGFDPSFFMFNEEVDLCYRLRAAGWRVVFFPGADFVHIGGASTRLDWDRMYREQLRSHLRFLEKHHGPSAAESGRRLLLWAMRLRSVIFKGERQRLSRDAAAWLASGDAATLLDLRA